MIVHHLCTAEASLRRSATERAWAVGEIKDALDAIRTYNQQGAGWSPAYYSYLAAEVSLDLGNAAQAKAILLRGLQLEPNSEVLNYLSRILLREGILQPTEVPPVT